MKETQGTRETGELPGGPQRSEGPSGSSNSSTEVVAIAKRRRFSSGYKNRLLEEADRCQDVGSIGALLRREGLYASHLSAWRKLRRQKMEQVRKRGPAPKHDPTAKERKRLERENLRLRNELKKAEIIISFQKKLADLLGTPLGTPPELEGSEL